MISNSAHISTMRRLFFTALIIFFSQIALAEVFISPVLNTDANQKNYVIGPGQYLVIPLPGNGDPRNAYKISINATNAIYKDITAFVVDDANARLFQQGYEYRGIGYQKAMAPFVIQGGTQTPGPHYLILDNRFAAFISKKLNITIEASLRLEPAAHKKIETSFSGMYTGLKQKLVFPEFNIRVEPCGQVNAFSESFGSGDIHYCTEMIARTLGNNNMGAFVFIFLHEVGHSLLGLWGVPGNNNEDIADEFATYIMMSGGPAGYAMLDRSLEFWQNRDSTAEAMNMLKNGDRHSLSIQRVRNIKENIQRGTQFIARWNQLIYPHSTTTALEDIVKNPKHGESIELAQNVLEQRNKLSTSN